MGNGEEEPALAFAFGGLKAGVFPAGGVIGGLVLAAEDAGFGPAGWAVAGSDKSLQALTKTVFGARHV